MDETASPDRALRQWIGEQLACSAESIDLTPCETGRYNQSRFVRAGPNECVLRMAPPDEPERHLFYEYRMMRREPAIHRFVREQSNVVAPRIVAHQPIVPPLERDLILMERLPGDPLSETPDLKESQLEEVLRGIGRWLREIHAIQGSLFGYPTYLDNDGIEQGPMPQRTTWIEAFAIMWDRLIDDIEHCQGYEPAEAQLMRQLLTRYSEHFEHCATPSLLHMDVWAENILVDQHGQLTGLIDWDRALWGDPEIEFAVLDYCGISTPAFWEGYGRPDPRTDDPKAQIRRIFYLLYELQKYIVIHLARHETPRSAESYKQQSFQLAQKIL